MANAMGCRFFYTVVRVTVVGGALQNHDPLRLLLGPGHFPIGSLRINRPPRPLIMH